MALTVELEPHVSEVLFHHAEIDMLRKSGTPRIAARIH